MSETYDEMQILAYVEGDMPAEEAHRFKLTMLTGARLRRLVEQLVADRDALRAMPMESSPAEMMDRVNEHIERDMLLRPAGHVGGSTRVSAERQFKLVRVATFAGLAAMLMLGVGLMIATFKDMSQIGELSRPASVASKRQVVGEGVDAGERADELRRVVTDGGTPVDNAESGKNAVKDASPQPPAMMPAPAKKTDSGIARTDKPGEHPAMAMARATSSSPSGPLPDDDAGLKKEKGLVVLGDSANNAPSVVAPVSPPSPAPVVTMDSSMSRRVATRVEKKGSEAAAVATAGSADVAMPTSEVSVSITAAAESADASQIERLVGAAGSPGAFNPKTDMGAVMPMTSLSSRVHEADAIDEDVSTTEPSIVMPTVEHAVSLANLSLAVVSPKADDALMRLIKWSASRGVTVSFADSHKPLAQEVDGLPGAELLPRMGEERIRLSIRIKARDLQDLVDIYDLNPWESAWLVRVPTRRYSSVLSSKQKQRANEQAARKASRSIAMPRGWIDFSDLIAQEMPIDPASLKLEPDQEITLGLIIRDPVQVHRPHTEATEQDAN